MSGRDVWVRSGSALVRSGGALVVEAADGDRHPIAPVRGGLIWCDPGVRLDADALRTACRSGWDVLLVDHRGGPAVRAAHVEPPSAGLVRTRQLLLRPEAGGRAVAVALVRAKLLNQGHLLRSLGMASPGALAVASRLIRMAHGLDRLRPDRPRLLAVEGLASRLYFPALAGIIGRPALFSGRRTLHPADDAGNAILSYGYAIVYGKVLRAIHAVGLDPYLGFLHVDRPGRISLVYDIAEVFKQPLVDRVLVRLRRTHCRTVASEDGVRLARATRDRVLEEIDRRLSAPLRLGSRRITWADLFLVEARRLAAFVTGARTAYRPHVHDWH